MDTFFAEEAPHWLREAISYPSDKYDDIGEVTLAGDIEEVREEHDHELAGPSILCCT